MAHTIISWNEPHIIIDFDMRNLDSSNQFRWTADQNQIFNDFVQQNRDFLAHINTVPPTQKLTETGLRGFAVPDSLRYDLGFYGLEGIANLKKERVISIVDVKVLRKTVAVYNKLQSEHNHELADLEHSQPMKFSKKHAEQQIVTDLLTFSDGSEDTRSKNLSIRAENKQNNVNLRGTSAVSYPEPETSYAHGDAFAGLYASPFHYSSLPFGDTERQKPIEDQSRTGSLGLNQNQQNHSRSQLVADGKAFAGQSRPPANHSSLPFGHADSQTIKAEGKPTRTLGPNQNNHLGYTIHPPPTQPTPSPHLRDQRNRQQYPKYNESTDGESSNESGSEPVFSPNPKDRVHATGGAADGLGMNASYSTSTQPPVFSNHQSHRLPSQPTFNPDAASTSNASQYVAAPRTLTIPPPAFVPVFPSSDSQEPHSNRQSRNCKHGFVPLKRR